MIIYTKKSNCWKTFKLSNLILIQNNKYSDEILRREKILRKINIESLSVNINYVILVDFDDVIIFCNIIKNMIVNIFISY